MCMATKQFYLVHSSSVWYMWYSSDHSWKGSQTLTLLSKENLILLISWQANVYSFLQLFPPNNSLCQLSWHYPKGHNVNLSPSRYSLLYQWMIEYQSIELIVPWEENQEEAHERKKNRYETLRADCGEKGWICHVILIEVGCHGFIGHSVISFLSKIGITGRSLKVASNRLQTTARYASSWIWSKVRKFPAWR